MSEPLDDHKVWMVVRTDTHGVKYLMADDLGEAEAKQYLKGILDKQTKPHHQDYELIHYLRSQRAQRIKEWGIHPQFTPKAGPV